MIKFTWKPVMGETTMKITDTFKEMHPSAQLDMLQDSICELKELYNKLLMSPDSKTAVDFWKDIK
jgi:hypothetical protein